MVDARLQHLLQGNPALWQAGKISRAGRRVVPSGFAALDAVLPGGGWPADALLEIISPLRAIGELQLLLPAMVELTRRGNWLVWIAPPYLPYAPALVASGIELKRVLVLPAASVKDQADWALEKILRSNACGMALAWPSTLSPGRVRRLQLAAQEGGSLGVLFRDQDVSASPAAMRLRLQALADGLQVEILKARGGAQCRVRVDLTQR